MTDTVLGLKDKREFTIESLKLTTNLLELNPEFNAVWNYRRDIIVDQ